MILLLSIFFGLFLTWVGFRELGALGGLWMAGAWSMSPLFLAHATLVTTDLAFTFFFFSFFYLLTLPQGRARDLAAGVSLGLCFGSKYFAIAIIPILLAVGAWRFPAMFCI